MRNLFKIVLMVVIMTITFLNVMMVLMPGWYVPWAVKTVVACAVLCCIATCVALLTADKKKAFEWPVLEEPATVGHGTFGQGVSSKAVIDAAQRAAKARWVEERNPKTPAELADQELARRRFWDMLHGDPTAPDFADQVKAGENARWMCGND